MKVNILVIDENRIVEIEVNSFGNNMIFVGGSDMMFCLADGYHNCVEESGLILTDESLKICRELMVVKNIIE